MSPTDLDPSEVWAPQACTLPTREQPLRVTEFDRLFARAVRGIHRPEPGRLRLELEPTAPIAARTADLVVRETGCCSFFTFALTATHGRLWLEVSVTAEHLEVLDAFAARAAVDRHT